MIVTTMNDIPGTRSPTCSASAGTDRSLPEHRLPDRCEPQADPRMIAEAEAKGANAIIAMRFDTSEMGPQWTEICIRNAVKVTKT